MIAQSVFEAHAFRDVQSIMASAANNGDGIIPMESPGTGRGLIIRGICVRCMIPMSNNIAHVHY